jgi:glycosyltransferase involved in cell wall biosynthesis
VKLAFICGSAGDGHCGVGDYTYALAQHLALDAEVHVFYDKLYGPAEPPFRELTTLHLQPMAGFGIFNLYDLRNKVVNGGFDIVHLQYPSKAFGTGLAPVFLLESLTGMQSRSRLVATIHEWGTSQLPRKVATRHIMNSLQGLVLTNEAELPAIEKRFGGREITVMPVGNLLTSHAELEQVWGAAGPKLAEPSGLLRRIPDSLFHYGLPAKGKGLLRLLEALSLVRESRPAVKLYLAGAFMPGQPLTEEVLNTITALNLAGAVEKVGHLPLTAIAEHAERCCLGVFPFDEGFSSKRSSVASISHLDLPLVVGAGSREEHPYYAPEQNTAPALAVLILELLSGRLGLEWEGQVRRQRAWGRRFSFSAIAKQHLDFYTTLLNRSMGA